MIVTLQKLKQLVQEAASEVGPLYKQNGAEMSLALLKQALRDAGFTDGFDYRVAPARDSRSASLVVHSRRGAQIAPRALTAAGFEHTVEKRDPRTGGAVIRVKLAEPEPRDASEPLEIPQIDGVEDVTTDRQRKNGNVSLLDTVTGDVYGIYANGYVRITRPTTNFMGIPSPPQVIGSPGTSRSEQAELVRKRVALRRSKKAAGKL